MKNLKSEILNLKLKTGFVLVESVVAMTIIVVGLLGIFSLLSQSLSLNRVVGDRYVGTYLAVEGIEVVKNIIDNNIVNGRPWNAGLGNGQYEVDYDSLSLEADMNRAIKFDDLDGRYSYRGGKDTRFRRTITVELLGGGEEIKVNSLVRWIGRGDADFEVNLEDHFFNWR